MWNIDLFISSIIGLLSLAFILTIAFWPMRELRVDEFRQNVFAIRDELFLFVGRSESMNYDHPAYGYLRTMLNGTIRYSHRFSLLHFVVLAWWNQRAGLLGINFKTFEAEWDDALASLNDHDRFEIENFRNRLTLEIARYLLLGSYTKVVVFYPAITAFNWLFERSRNRQGRGIDEEVVSNLPEPRWVNSASASSLHFGIVRDRVETFETGAYLVGRSHGLATSSL